MRAKSLIELLTLSTNLYMISKDDEFMQNLSEMLNKGKRKAEDIIEEFSMEGEDGEEKLIQKMMHKARQAKADLEQKVEEIAVKVYDKMHIANTDDLKIMSQRIEKMEQKLSLLEARLSGLEKKNA